VIVGNQKLAGGRVLHCVTIIPTCVDKASTS
jgi:hypothetical protein